MKIWHHLVRPIKSIESLGLINGLERHAGHHYSIHHRDGNRVCADGRDARHKGLRDQPAQVRNRVGGRPAAPGARNARLDVAGVRVRRQRLRRCVSVSRSSAPVPRTLIRYPPAPRSFGPQLLVQRDARTGLDDPGR